MADGQSSIVWDTNEYKLAYLLDNFPLPQMIRVAEGFMLTEDDSLSSGTVLTLHGLKTITKLKGQDGHGREISVPLNCPDDVKLVSGNDRNDIVFRTVEDICNSNVIPEYVRLNRRLSRNKVMLNLGELLKVECIDFTKHGQANGIKVTTLGGNEGGKRLLLPLDTTGDFVPFMPQDFETKVFKIKELATSCIFPFAIEFVSRNEKNSLYGPHLGEIELREVITAEIVLATSKIDDITYAVIFPRDLPVTIQVAHGMLNDDSFYSNICQIFHEEVDLKLIEDMLESDPRAGFCLSTTVYSNIPRSQNTPLLSKNRESHKSGPVSELSQSSPNQPHDSQSPEHIRPKLPPPVPTRPPSLKRKSYTSSDSISNLVPIQSDTNVKKKSPAIPSEGLQATSSTPVTPTKTRTPTSPMLAGQSSSGSYCLKPITSKAKIPEKSSISAESSSDDDAYEEVGEFTQPSIVKKSASPPTLPPKRNKEYSYPTWLPPKSGKKQPIVAKQASHETEINLTEGGLSKKNGLRSSLTRIPNQEAGAVNQVSDHIDSAEQQQRAKKRPPVAPRRSKKKVSSHEYEYPLWVPEKPDGSHQGSEVKNTREDGECSVSDTTLSLPVADITIDKVTGKDSKVLKSQKMNLSEVEPFDETLEIEKDICNMNTYREPNEQMHLEEAEYLEFDPYQSFQDGELRKLDTTYDLSVTTEKSVTAKDESEICKILDRLNLSDFKTTFQENQINGEFLMELNQSDFVEELEMSKFQAMKLDKYIHGWLPDSMKTTNVANKDSLDPTLWSSVHVHDYMQSLNLHGFATFCQDNEINGELLKSILDEDILDDIKSSHNVQVTKLEEKRLRSFVLKGWRPDKIKKGRTMTL